MTDTFTFDKFSWEVNYPESSAKVPFGRGYEFASAPEGPDQVKYTLYFAGMWFKESSPGTIDKTWQPTINIAVLEDFYKAHKLYVPFTLPLPGAGNLSVRFATPLKYKLKEGGFGLVEPFTLDMLLQP